MTINLDRNTLGAVLAELDVYVPGLSYQETATKIINRLPASPDCIDLEQGTDGVWAVKA